ncbi:MAG: hypothetical protein E6Q97_24660 [Desulfurellales bacterium]|nr:MAG: hypothetical protein E6Q97_24660 [Desulfurellales bacterium]
MARYSLSWTSVTPTAVADTTNFADGAYPTFLQGGSATMQLAISELFMGGEASSTSSPTVMVLARDSTVAATGISGNRNALLDAGSTAPGTVAVFGNTSTTKPQRSSTLHLLKLSFNAYGGLVRWQARHGEEITVVGASASLGEVSLSAFTGGTPGAQSGHILYEVR